jgi:uncharacterized membrane protein YphA (DoxX/SURF4 family)
MKVAVNLARIVVGLLFVFSGLVKANDPLGLSYKMQEFFEIWGIHQFNSWTLLMSVLMNAFEIIAGFALLLGWRIKLFSWLLLLLIVFFTFLTGYTYVTGTPKNCGCFGDCLPITSKTSFLKDVVLTLLIGFLFWKQKLIKPICSEKMNTLVMLFITVFSFGFQWVTLNYLPVVDCLPYKKGNNIKELMKMPANAIPDSNVITFVYNKNGKEVEFTALNFPADFNADTYKFVRRFDKLIRKGKNNEPPIKGFVLTGPANIDSTDYVLNQPYSVILFCEKFTTAGTAWKEKFEKVYAAATVKNIPCFIVTAEPAESNKSLAGTSFKDIPVFKCDYKAIQTASRSELTVYLLNNGTIKSKYSGKKVTSVINDLAPLAIQEIPITIPTEAMTPDTLNQLSPANKE